MSCTFCGDPTAELLSFGRKTVEFCPRHAAFAKNGARELAGLSARAAGVALQRKAPNLFAAGQAVWQAFRAAQARNEGETPS